MLQQPRGIVHETRRMNQYDVLGRYLPEFGRIVGQMQHDLFHVYTVDQHILMVLRNVRRFAMPELAHEFPLCSQLMSGFERRWLLYVAALFHDIAKGRGGDHSDLGSRDARRFCRRHGLPREDEDLVAFLVEQHLTMSRVAQKQDVYDPAVVQQFADQVGSHTGYVEVQSPLSEFVKASSIIVKRAGAFLFILPAGALVMILGLDELCGFLQLRFINKYGVGLQQRRFINPRY